MNKEMSYWNLKWKEVFPEGAKNTSPEFWDRYAASFRKKSGTDDYTDFFIGCSGIKPGDTVFDMGCGAGVLQQGS